MKLEDFLNHEGNRRQFLGSSTKGAAGVAAGLVGISTTVAADSPSGRVNVGVIGARNCGRELATTLGSFPDVSVTAICDVDESVLAESVRAVEEVGSRVPTKHRDFRRVLDDPSIDAVIIATPDHWHGVMASLAIQAGKDVYLETPVAHSIEESRRIIQVAASSDRVIQVGLQERSGPHFQSAIEVVRSGQIGRVALARAWATHRRKSIGAKAERRAPRTADYEMWLGPAPKRAFHPNRFHHNWHWFWDYGSGELGKWGVHLLDVARWGLGVEFPDRVSANGGKYAFNDDQETPDTLLATYSFGDKTIVWEHRQWSNHAMEGRSAAAAFYGDAGTLIVDRGGWKVYDSSENLTDSSSNLLSNHLRGFIDCVKSREQPAAGLEVGHASTTLCHLGNIAYRVGHEIHFDAKKQLIVGDPSASQLLGGNIRAPWSV